MIVNVLRGESKIVLNDIKEEMTIASLKNIIMTKTDIPVENQRLIFLGKVLKNEQTIKENGIKEGDTLILSRREAGTADVGTAEVGTAGQGMRRSPAIQFNDLREPLHPSPDPIASGATYINPNTYFPPSTFLDTWNQVLRQRGRYNFEEVPSNQGASTQDLNELLRTSSELVERTRRLLIEEDDDVSPTPTPRPSNLVSPRYEEDVEISPYMGSVTELNPIFKEYQKSSCTNKGLKNKDWIESNCQSCNDDLMFSEFEDEDVNDIISIHVMENEHEFNTNGKCILKQYIKNLLKSDLTTTSPIVLQSIYTKPLNPQHGDDFITGMTAKATSRLVMKIPIVEIYVTLNSIKKIMVNETKNWYAIPLFKNKRRRIGNIMSFYGSSNNHGQIPGFKVYKLFTKEELTSLYSFTETDDDYVDLYGSGPFDKKRVLGDLNYSILSKSVIKYLLDNTKKVGEYTSPFAPIKPVDINISSIIKDSPNEDVMIESICKTLYDNGFPFCELTQDENTDEIVEIFIDDLAEYVDYVLEQKEIKGEFTNEELKQLTDRFTDLVDEIHNIRLSFV